MIQLLKSSVLFLPIINWSSRDTTCIFSTLNYVAQHSMWHHISTFDQPLSLWWKTLSIILFEPDGALWDISTKIKSFPHGDKLSRQYRTPDGWFRYEEAVGANFCTKCSRSQSCLGKPFPGLYVGISFWMLFCRFFCYMNFLVTIKTTFMLIHKHTMEKTGVPLQI